MAHELPGTPYFATAIIYKRKIFIKSTTDVNAKRLFFFFTDATTK
jgi:hypothetical protein